ncbi:hypothetical protein QWJ41_17410 [Nocardioides sp. SOB44]|uniref:Uncharacterized protein n=1 Tax=Nocardioides cremeus TaxID=3058044 RepID=A0ABT8TU63_9ACTN|nr:hypothetical protein [Nocardioides cremeus]MDO3397508.1 hypothetical protein [Nocardioides cremeus]
MAERNKSSDDLKTAVATFMDRADKIVAHPLAGTHSTIKIVVTQDPESGTETAKLDRNLLPEEQWVYLATLMRSVIFLEQESISFNVLTNRIEREHEELRGRLKAGREGLKAWKKHVFVYSGLIGEAKVPLPEGKTAIQQVNFGPPGVSPSGVDLEMLSPDYEYADAYLNAQVWHSDNAKARMYQAAGEDQKQHYRKCAEIRVISAIDIVAQLRQWILDARTDGWDL